MEKSLVNMLMGRAIENKLNTLKMFFSLQLMQLESSNF